jgi:hypothetical protein
MPCGRCAEAENLVFSHVHRSCLAGVNPSPCTSRDSDSPV